MVIVDRIVFLAMSLMRESARTQRQVLRELRQSITALEQNRITKKDFKREVFRSLNRLK